jgi:hypothetical protein
MQTTTSTCPPWVSTPMVGCTTLAAAATVGRQVLTPGTAAKRTPCSSEVATSS